jgi:hypothetical protein
VSRLRLLLSVFLLAGCGGTYLRVQVQRAPDRKPVAGASVLLYDLNDDPCRDSPSGGQGTDSVGQAEVRAHYCGRARLYVSAENFEPVVRVLDTCAAQAIDVVLADAQQPVADGGDAALAALRFVEAILSGNLAATRALLMDPGTAELYLKDGIREDGRPYSVRITKVSSASNATVELELLYDTGCRAHWHFVLKLDRSEWRVLELAPMLP